jgi:deoxyribodipyrimidine photolyase-like uncharacterized protein
MEQRISVKQFIRAIEKLKEDELRENSRVWYLSQKEHWLGWLSQYDTPGGYGRIPGQNRDAKYAYNHIVCSQMLLYLIKAIPVRQALIDAAEEACKDKPSLMAKSGAIRKIVPWSEIYQALFANPEPSLLDRIFHKGKKSE